MPPPIIPGPKFVSFRVLYGVTSVVYATFDVRKSPGKPLFLRTLQKVGTGQTCVYSGTHDKNGTYLNFGTDAELDF